MQHVEVGLGLPLPAQLVLHPLTSRLTELLLPLAIVDQLDELVAESRDVARRYEHAGQPDRTPGLQQIERDHRQTERHLLHRLTGETSLCSDVSMPTSAAARQPKTS